MLVMKELNRCRGGRMTPKSSKVELEVKIWVTWKGLAESKPVVDQLEDTKRRKMRVHIFNKMPMGKGEPESLISFQRRELLLVWGE